MAVGNYARDQIDHEVGQASVSGVFDLRDVLELIIDRFYDGTLPEHKLVREVHDLVFHVGAQLGDQLNATLEQLSEQRLCDVASVSE